jgi:capsular exopolysaccharide synthesis family protein
VSRKEARGAETAPRVANVYAAEQYRVLGHIVQQLGKLEKRVIAISSPVAGDGKTTTSINLASTLSQSAGSRVLLIDADLRRGTLCEQLGLVRPAGPGLAGAIADEAIALESVVRRRPGLPFAVLPAGTCPVMPYEALHSSRTGEILKAARQSFDYVLVDTPPVVPVADLLALSDWVDGIFLVVSAHGTPRGLLDEALSSMDPAKVVGIIYNGDDLPLLNRHRAYYSYGERGSAPGRSPSILASPPNRP